MAAGIRPRACCISEGDLYVGGAIDIADGNAGHGIMRLRSKPIPSVAVTCAELQETVPAVQLEKLTKLVRSRQLAVRRSADSILLAQCPAVRRLPLQMNRTLVSVSWLGQFPHCDLLQLLPRHHLRRPEWYPGQCGCELCGRAVRRRLYPDTCARVPNTSILDPSSAIRSRCIPNHLDRLDILIAHLPLGASPCRMECLDGMGRVGQCAFGNNSSVQHRTTGPRLYIVPAEGYGAQRVSLDRYPRQSPFYLRHPHPTGTHIMLRSMAGFGRAEGLVNPAPPTLRPRRSP